MNKTIFSSDPQVSQSADIRELMVLLTTQEDRLPREVVNECARRGAAIVPHLRALLNDGHNWGAAASAGQWWSLLHALMILGAIPGPEAAEALLEGFRHLETQSDDHLWDWLAGYWPALFRNKREHVLSKLEHIAGDSQRSWYIRIHALECVLEAAQAAGPDALEQRLDWVRELVQNKQSDLDFLGLAGSILLDFPRSRHRPALEELGNWLDRNCRMAPAFTAADVGKAFQRDKDQPDWERFANPWQFYDPEAIRLRQERWAEEDAAREREERHTHTADWEPIQTMVRDTPKVGRNDPCPCGSGKKYKKCCLSKVTESTPTDLLWHRLRRAIEGLPRQLLAFADDHCGPQALAEAWDEFVLEEGRPFAPDDPLIQVFMPWFLYNWTPDAVNSSVPPDSLQDRTIAEAFLRSRKGAHLDALARRYVEQAIGTPFSFHDVAACRPGQGFTLRNIYTGEQLEVTERAGSQAAQPGDILLTKLVRIDDVVVMECCAPILIPPQYKGAILELRKMMRAQQEAISETLVADYDLEILELYQEITEQLLNPALPQLQNTDGETLRLQDLIFDIESPEVAFEALWPLSLEAHQDELLAAAKRDAEGRLEQIEFPWLRQGKRRHKQGDNTVLASIRIEGHRLNIHVNSDERAAHIKNEVQARLGEGARYRTTLHHSIEKMLEEQQDAAGDGTATAGNDELAVHPEVQAKLTEIMDAHWDNWIHEQLPALNGKTPLEAVQDPDGREMVEALLAQFQRTRANLPLPADYDPLPTLRKRLGLDQADI